MLSEFWNSLTFFFPSIPFSFPRLSAPPPFDHSQLYCKFVERLPNGKYVSHRDHSVEYVPGKLTFISTKFNPEPTSTADALYFTDFYSAIINFFNMGTHLAILKIPLGNTPVLVPFVDAPNLKKWKTPVLEVVDIINVWDLPKYLPNPTSFLIVPLQPPDTFLARVLNEYPSLIRFVEEKDYSDELLTIVSNKEDRCFKYLLEKSYTKDLIMRLANIKLSLLTYILREHLTEEICAELICARQDCVAVYLPKKCLTGSLVSRILREKITSEEKHFYFLYSFPEEIFTSELCYEIFRANSRSGLYWLPEKVWTEEMLTSLMSHPEINDEDRSTILQFNKDTIIKKELIQKCDIQKYKTRQ